MSADFVVDRNTGLAFFPSLEKSFGIKNFITYDNSKWGNMAYSLAETEAEKQRIKRLDRKLMRLTGAKYSFVMSTPPEATLLVLDKPQITYLLKGSVLEKTPGREILVRANSVIAERFKIPYQIVVGPADCAVFIGVFKKQPVNFNGVIVMHIGFPQVYQRLHIRTLELAAATYNLSPSDLSALKFYITPYICPRHYSISKKVFDYLAYNTVIRKRLARFVEYKNDKYFVDFVGLAKFELEKSFGIAEFVESGVCTYEAAAQNALFSYTRYKEGSQRKGVFSVVVGVRSES